MATSHPHSCGDKRVVIIAMDGSEHAEFAFRFYVKNVHQTGDHVFLVHCAEYGFFAFGDAEMAKKYHEEESRIKRLMDELEALLLSNGLNGTVARFSGPPGHSICEKANETNADVIITGCRGLGQMRRTLMGSVSDYIVHHSNIPVLVCRMPPTTHAQ